MKRFYLIISCSLLLLLIISLGLFFCFYEQNQYLLKNPLPAPSQSSQPSQPLDQRVLTVGFLFPYPKEVIKKAEPLTQYLTKKLANVGISHVQFKHFRNVSELGKMLRSGEVDIVTDGSFHTMALIQKAGIKPLLRVWREGLPSYHTIIFVRQDSGIINLDDLRGKIISFERATTTTGYLLPKASLLNHGLSLVKYKQIPNFVPLQETAYIFSEDEENTMIWVLENKVNAGVVNSSDYAALAGSRLNELKVLARTPEVPTHIVSFRIDLDPSLIEALESTLVNMDQDHEGTEALKAFNNTAKFERFPDGAEKAFAPLWNLFCLVKQEQEEIPNKGDVSSNAKN